MSIRMKVRSTEEADSPASATGKGCVSVFLAVLVGAGLFLK